MEGDDEAEVAPEGHCGVYVEDLMGTEWVAGLKYLGLAFRRMGLEVRATS
jgi:hypothetical protein